MTNTHYEAGGPDYPFVPHGFKHLVCACGGRAGATNPQHWLTGASYPTPEMRAAYPLMFNWWVCSECAKPMPMNALNARLIRECEMCESAYLIIKWPDRNDVCPECD